MTSLRGQTPGSISSIQSIFLLWMEQGGRSHLGLRRTETRNNDCLD